VVLASLWVQVAWAWSPGTAEGPRTEDQGTRLEITLGRGLVPSAQILGWVLMIDGARIEGAHSEWAGYLPPGPHTVGLRVHYWRDLKTLITHTDDNRLGFTFVAAGGRWAGKDYSVEASPSSVVRLAATLEDNAEAIADRVLVANSVQNYGASERARATGEDDPSPALASAPRPLRVERGIAHQVRKRAAWVTALVSQKLLREAGRGGDAMVRVAVDRDGYLRDFRLDSPTGVELLDQSVGEVLRLAEPYPRFDGYLTVKLPFANADPPPDCPF
jgi:hypothetical protein